MPLAHCLVLFPTAHKSMRNCHSPGLVPVAIAGLNAISLLPPLDVHPAHCPLQFSTAHKSMCTCPSPRLVQVDVAGLHCLCCGAAELLYDGSGLTPANNPGLEIPFLAVICLNFAQFTAAKSQPSLQISVRWFVCKNCGSRREILVTTVKRHSAG